MNRLVKDPGGLWRGTCGACGWQSPLLMSKTKARKARQQHYLAVHKESVTPTPGEGQE